MANLWGREAAAAWLQSDQRTAAWPEEVAGLFSEMNGEELSSLSRGDLEGLGLRGVQLWRFQRSLEAAHLGALELLCQRLTGGEEVLPELVQALGSGFRGAHLAAEGLGLMRSSSKTPFGSDAEVLLCWEILLLIKRSLLALQEEAEKPSCLLGQVAAAPAQVAKGFGMAERAVRQFVEGKERASRACFEASDRTVPRLLRVFWRFGFSQKERVAFMFILASNIGRILPPPPSSMNQADIRTFTFLLAQYSGMDPQEVLEFLEPSRQHMQQVLFQPDDEFSTIMSSQFLVISPVALRVLTGLPLSGEDFFKVDKTELAEVLTEEAPLQRGGPPAPRESGDTSALGGGELEDEDLLRELEELAEDASSSESLAQEDGADKEAGASETSDPHQDPLSFKPYTSDLEYLQDHFELVTTKLKIRRINFSDDDYSGISADKRKPEAVLRELSAKVRSQSSRVEKRLAATFASSDWKPRMEDLVQKRGLVEFEKMVLLILIGFKISPGVRKAAGYQNGLVSNSQTDINTLISCMHSELEEQISARKHFYRKATLVREGLIRVTNPPFRNSVDLLDQVVEMDRKILDYIAGLDTEMGDLVEGSDLYTPTTTFDSVILPKKIKEMILETVLGHGRFRDRLEELHLSEQSTSKGLCLLFYGPSGTGKTMTANAIGGVLGKKILSVNLSSSTDTMELKEYLRLVFREAKIQNACLFFDECEALFESRINRASPVGVLLTQIEAFEGVIILATNRHHDLDEALFRRINLAIRFRHPDYSLRQQIWLSLIPKELECDEDIDWKGLALRYELTGGLIKNAIVSALSIAMSKALPGEKVVITQGHLEEGAKLQKLSQGLLKDQDRKGERKKAIKSKLSDLVLPEQVSGLCAQIVSYEKARKVMFGHWGLEKHLEQGTTVLLRGVSGVGKSTLAAAIAGELELESREIGCREIVFSLSSGASGASFLPASLEEAFRDPSSQTPVLVFDEVELLYSSGSKLVDMYSGLRDVADLLRYKIDHYPGLVILLSSPQEELALGRFKQLRFEATIPLPTFQERQELWRRSLPLAAPQEEGIDFGELSRRYPEVAPAVIVAAVYDAAKTAALRKDEDQRITMADLIASTKKEIERASRPKGDSKYKTMFQ